MIKTHMSAEFITVLMDLIMLASMDINKIDKWSVEDCKEYCSKDVFKIVKKFQRKKLLEKIEWVRNNGEAVLKRIEDGIPEEFDDLEMYEIIRLRVIELKIDFMKEYNEFIDFDLDYFYKYLISYYDAYGIRTSIQEDMLIELQRVPLEEIAAKLKTYLFPIHVNQPHQYDLTSFLSGFGYIEPVSLENFTKPSFLCGMYKKYLPKENYKYYENYSPELENVIPPESLSYQFIQMCNDPRQELLKTRLLSVVYYLILDLL